MDLLTIKETPWGPVDKQKVIWSPNSQPDDSCKWLKRESAILNHCTPSIANELLTKFEDRKEEEDQKFNVLSYRLGNPTLPTLSNHPHMQVWVLWWCVRSSQYNTFQKVHQWLIPGFVIHNQQVFLRGLSQSVYLLRPIIVVQAIVKNKPACCRTTKTQVEGFVYKLERLVKSM